MSTLQRALGLLVKHRRPLFGIPGLYVSYVHFLAYAGLVIGSLIQRPLIAGAAMAVAVIVEAADILPRDRRDRGLTAWRRGLDVRAQWRALLFVIALAAGAAAHELIVAFGIVALGAAGAIRIMRSNRLHLGTTTRLRPIGAMKTGVDNLERARRRARLRDLSELPLQMAVGFGGFALSLPTQSEVTPAAVIAIALALMVAAVGYAGLIAIACRRLRPQMLLRHDDEVLAEFLAYDPEVLCYFNGHAGSTYAVDVWLRTFEASHRRIGLVYRHNDVRSVDTDLLPGIVVRRDAMVEKGIGPSTKIALYPANGTLNVHMQRDKRLVHVFIGHGDSDKAGSASPFSRSYDEVWVSGGAGIDRYRGAGIDIPDDRFTIVGRPPLSPKVRAMEAQRSAERDRLLGQTPAIDELLQELDRMDGGERPTTLLYAPTWEGYFDASNYSSIASLGVDLIRLLLAEFPEVRVIYKPHPMTGRRLPEMVEASDEMQDLLSGGHHPSAIEHDGVDLYAWFDLADILVCDVSSVLTDFMAWDRPYIVTNPLELKTHEFHRRFPSTEGAYILDPDAPSNRMVLRSALELDPLAPRRHELRRHFLGDPERDPLTEFEDALDRAYDATARSV